MSNPKITCVIVDDEPMALNLVESYVQKTPFLLLKKKFSSALEAMGFLKEEPVDLLFLDIANEDLAEVTPMIEEGIWLIVADPLYRGDITLED